MNLSIRGLATEPGPYRRLLVGVGLDGLGNFSATLLILRATDLLHTGGRSQADAAAIAVLLYAAHNAANSLFAYPAGAVADRYGRRHVLVFGIGLFAVASLGFIGDSPSIPLSALLFVLVGASTALVETGQGADAAELLHDSIRGRGFGVLGLVDGIGDLVSSVVVGVLFTVTDPAWGFVYAAVLATTGAIVLGIRVLTEPDHAVCDLNTPRPDELARLPRSDDIATIASRSARAAGDGAGRPGRSHAVGIIAATIAFAVNPTDARASADQNWSPFVLVAGLLLIGLVADDDGLFAAGGSSTRANAAQWRRVVHRDRRHDRHRDLHC